VLTEGRERGERKWGIYTFENKKKKVNRDYIHDCNSSSRSQCSLKSVGTFTFTFIFVHIIFIFWRLIKCQK